MNDDEYMILFDQNGSPYIAHASLSEMRQRTAGALRSARSAVGSAAGAVKQGVGRGVRTTHKYIQKIEENGRTRYFYTQEELKAYLAEKKAAAQQTVNKAKEKARAGMGEAQEKASKARTRAEQIGNEFKNKASGAVNEAKASARAYKEYQDAGKQASDENFSEASKDRMKKAWSELQKHPAGMKAEMARRKVAEAGEAVENAADDVKEKASEVASNAKETARKAKEEIQQKLKDHNGSPSNSNSETRSMLGSYATEIPSSPDKLKEWADNGKQQAQQVIKEAEDALKEIEQGYKNGEYTQYQMWTAQNIVDGMHDEMEEWEFLSNMSGEELSNLFGPLLKSKKS